MKRVLVISNGCFSQTDSNGRTLAKLFSGYDREKLAMFCTYGTPDFSVCGRYYKVTDSAALKSFLTRKSCGGVVPETQEAPAVAAGGKKKVRKTPFKALLRELAWRFGAWRGGALQKWLEEFAPEEVLLFPGDNAFLLDLAVQVAKKFGIKITIYTTEDYCFKNYNYLTKRISLLYPLFYGVLKRAYRRAEPYIKLGLFNSPMLKERYQAAYSYECRCMFARSDIEFVEKQPGIDKTNVQVSYLGNLGLNRHLPLMEIADSLAELIPGAKLDVYGKATEDVRAAFAANENVRYKGFVSYEDVVRIIHESDLVVHAEFNDPFYLKDLQAAFSTKIPDSICSGTPLLIYASEKLACTDFILKNGCGFAACSAAELKNVLHEALLDEKKRTQVMGMAHMVRARCFVSDAPMLSVFAETAK